MRSRRAARQIRRNIRGDLDEKKARRPGTGADALFHLLAALIAVLLPLSLVALAAGAVFRAPDFIAFEADRNGALRELGLDTTPEEVAGEIADYIRHKKDSLDLTTVIARKDVPVFSFVDEANLDRIRGLLDKSLYPAIGALALSFAFFAAARLAERRRYLRYALRASAPIYVCAVAFTLALALSQPFRAAVFARQPGLTFAEGDVLPRLFGGLYPLISASMVCLISFIIYIALYSVLIRFTVEKETMFR